jgi:hypothetical protein
MVEIKFRVIPEPPQGTRSIYRKKSEHNSDSGEPLVRGNFNGNLDYVCGNVVVVTYLVVK